MRKREKNEDARGVSLLLASSFHLEDVSTIAAFRIPSEIVIAQWQPESREVEGTGNRS